jgi:hypothetical protein
MQLRGLISRRALDRRSAELALGQRRAHDGFSRARWSIGDACAAPAAISCNALQQVKPPSAALILNEWAISTQRCARISAQARQLLRCAPKLLHYLRLARARPQTSRDVAHSRLSIVIFSWSLPLC